jgi:signal transduction histidine kinase
MPIRLRNAETNSQHLLFAAETYSCMSSPSLATLRHTQEFEAASQMVSGLAHDFNNLLMVISASAEFLAGSTPKDDARCNDIAQIQYAIDRAADLTRQLLAFSRTQEILEPEDVVGTDLPQ